MSSGPSRTAANTLSLNPFELGIFSKLNSDRELVTHEIQIDNQDTLSGYTYDQMHQLTMVDFPITRENFIIVWKALILKRVQDLYSYKIKRVAPHAITIPPNITIPGPLADLLYNLGDYYCPIEGVTHTVVPPARPDSEAPGWWTPSQANLRAWSLTMHRMKNCFTITTFPKRTHRAGRPLYHLVAEDANTERRVYLRFNTPEAADIAIVFANDTLFDPQPAVADCRMRMYELCSKADTIQEYVGRYAKMYAIPH